MPSLDQILAVILGGGKGQRLYPLTQQRSKPAVPIAGKYRLIDIPISNCINSGIFKIAVLTQYNSVSLHRHISRTYNFDAFHTGWVQVWAAAEHTMSSDDWYQGTADAVRKQLFEIRAARVQNVLILAGDHLYRMDYSAMAQFHGRRMPMSPSPSSRLPPRTHPAWASSSATRVPHHRLCRKAQGPSPPGRIGLSAPTPKSPSWGRWAFTCSNMRSCVPC